MGEAGPVSPAARAAAPGALLGPARPAAPPECRARATLGCVSAPAHFKPTPVFAGLSQAGDRAGGRAVALGRPPGRSHPGRGADSDTPSFLGTQGPTAFHSDLEVPSPPGADAAEPQDAPSLHCRPPPGDVGRDCGCLQLRLAGAADLASTTGKSVSSG